MSARLGALWRTYPPQFWLIMIGMLVSMIGTSLVWPFLTIYASEKLGLPLTQITLLLTLNGFISLGATLIAGPVADRLGRKGIMVLSLLGNGATYFLLGYAESYLAFAVLLSARGLFQPLFRVGTSAMVADIIPEDQRADAYALQRMASNLGIAIGPALGGFIVATSYDLSFRLAALGLIAFGLAIAFFARETRPSGEDALPGPRGLRVYSTVLHDRWFLTFVGCFVLFEMCMMMLWVLLGVYVKQNYGVSESLYGLIPATNATMVVLFQVAVTKVTKRYAPLPVMAVGAAVFALGVASIALGQGFWSFWLSFVVVTVGELIVAPTSNTYVANLAPASQRGRYLGFFTLSNGVGSSTAPLLGGVLNDTVGPQAIWLGGGLLGMASAAGFALMARLDQRRAQVQAGTRA